VRVITDELVVDGGRPREWIADDAVKFGFGRCRRSR